MFIPRNRPFKKKRNMFKKLYVLYACNKLP